jgi:nitroreductase
MDVARALEQRRMQRSFDGSPVDEQLVESLLVTSLRSPTAGHARGVAWRFGIGPDEVGAWFDVATDEPWRTTAARAGGLARASAVCVATCDPAAYVARYAEADKAGSGLGTGPEAWPVPYWIGDAGAACLALLLLAEERGLAACFLGAFRRDEHVRALLGLSDSELIYGTVLLGRADGRDHRSASLDRPGPTRAERVRRFGLG